MKSTFITDLALLTAITTYAEKQQPNIIMISFDDSNDWVGVYDGNEQVKIPNIDKYQIII